MDAANPYRSWAEWNDAEIKLLRKRNAAERKIGLAGSGDKERRALDRINAKIKEHRQFYIPSTVTYAFGSRVS